MKKKMLENLTFKEVDALDREKTLVLIPFGSMEQHGPHIPIGEDTMVANAITEGALKKIGDKISILALPAIPIGQSPEHMDFPGTLTFSAETYLAVIKDICTSVAHHGFKKIVLVNGHGGNPPALTAAGFDLRFTHGLSIFLFNAWAFIPFMGQELVEREAPRNIDFHGGELETSVMLALDPELVHMEWGVDETNPKFAQGKLITFTGPVFVNWNSKYDVAPSGISGQPSYGTAQKGKKIMDYLIESLCQTLEEIDKNW
jgi:creatinine amidohydrolase